MTTRPPRRYKARGQVSLVGTHSLSHTSEASTFERGLRTTAFCEKTYEESIRRAQHRRDLWTDDVHFQSNVARREQIEAQRIARATAHEELKLLKEEQRAFRNEKLAERRQRASQLDQSQDRARTEARLRLEHLQRQRREEEERRELARQKAAEEAERERIARLQRCAVCMEDRDSGVMVMTLCAHWYCPECLQGVYKLDQACARALN
jgi:hypothetical protein